MTLVPAYRISVCKAYNLIHQLKRCFVLLFNRSLSMVLFSGIHILLANQDGSKEFSESFCTLPVIYLKLFPCNKIMPRLSICLVYLFWLKVDGLLVLSSLTGCWIEKWSRLLLYHPHLRCHRVRLRQQLIFKCQMPPKIIWWTSF